MNQKPALGSRKTNRGRVGLFLLWNHDLFLVATFSRRVRFQPAQLDGVRAGFNGELHYVLVAPGGMRLTAVAAGPPEAAAVSLASQPPHTRGAPDRIESD